LDLERSPVADTPEERLRQQPAEEAARRAELEEALSNLACSDHGERPRVAFEQSGPTIIAACPEAWRLGNAALEEWQREAR
jgi:hypothetical protein